TRVSMPFIPWTFCNSSRPECALELLSWRRWGGCNHARKTDREWRGVLTALLIFGATYLVLAIGRLPGFRVDRTGAPIVGAALMLAANVLTVQEAYNAINYDTIMLLFG